jgi:hypothetical protein
MDDLVRLPRHLVKVEHQLKGDRPLGSNEPRLMSTDRVGGAAVTLRQQPR